MSDKRIKTITTTNDARGHDEKVNGFLKHLEYPETIKNKQFKDTTTLSMQITYVTVIKYYIDE